MHHNSLTVWLYDGSFDGLLSVIFDLYWQRRWDVRVRKEAGYMAGMFEDVSFKATIPANADRVWVGLQQKLSPEGQQRLFYSYLSGEADQEDYLIGYIRYMFDNHKDVTDNYGNTFVLHITQQAKKVSKEKHYMEAFIRFQLTKDGLYYALISPEHNVIPIIARHFKERYADQRWLIYDERRQYGIFYDLETVETVQMNFIRTNSVADNANTLADNVDMLTGNAGPLTDNVDALTDNANTFTCNADPLTGDVSPLAPEERLYQELWRTYFKEVNIESRKNLRLQVQHMPRRYWKYLPEFKVL